MRRGALAGGYSASHAKIAASIEMVWTTVLQIREYTKSAIQIYEFAYPHEYNPPKVLRWITVESRDQFLKRGVEIVDGMELH